MQGDRVRVDGGVEQFSHTGERARDVVHGINPVLQQFIQQRHGTRRVCLCQVDQSLETAWNGRLRRNGRRQAQAYGLTWPLKQQMLAAAAGDRLIDVRNCAMLGVAYDALLRRSELTALDLADFVEGKGGNATLLVRRAKND